MATGRRLHTLHQASLVWATYSGSVDLAHFVESGQLTEPPPIPYDGDRVRAIVGTGKVV